MEVCDQLTFAYRHLHVLELGTRQCMVCFTLWQLYPWCKSHRCPLITRSSGLQNGSGGIAGEKDFTPARNRTAVAQHTASRFTEGRYTVMNYANYFIWYTHPSHWGFFLVSFSIEAGVCPVDGLRFGSFENKTHKYEIWQLLFLKKLRVP
jgi:hypothetical protein